VDELTMKLSLENLEHLPPTIKRPRYARADLSAGIVHIGIGNFHRAHMALYMHDLFNQGRDHDWAIVGGSVRSQDLPIRADLKGQDWLTTLVELDPDADHPIVTGSMIDYATIEEDNRSLITAMAAPEIRIVSLTVTEGGYYIDPATGKFDPDHPDILADAAAPARPCTAFGAIIAALSERQARGLEAFTVMSCDNLPENGHVAKATVTGLAEKGDPALADWIGELVAFPCSMVDRITPGTTDRERAMVRDRYDIDDPRPVVCEGFRQWVLEDSFSAGRPAFEAAGVTMTPNVAPYEMMKIRILNGGHAAMAYPSALLDIEFVHDAAKHPLIEGFLDRLETEEIIPMVPPVPDTDLTQYYLQVKGRLQNPGVGDTISRLCFDGSNRQPKFILPTIRERLKQGLTIEGLSLVSAMWCRYLQGRSDSGRDIQIDDPSRASITAHAERAHANPLAFLEQREIFGDIADSQVFRKAFEGHLTAITRDGAAAVLSGYAA
jgi:mannitol 2-dehydrogenase